MNKIYVLSAASGVGKTSLKDFVLKDFPNIKYSISATTRKPREGEVEGVHYFFKTKEQFEELQIDGIGEIVVTGKNVLKGYVNGIGDKENKFSVDGVKYHRTGDLGKIDEKNRLFISERFFNKYNKRER